MLYQCIRHSVFPSNMKNAELRSRHKKENQRNKVIYRPVGFFSVISKIYESVMFDKVGDYFDSIFEDLLVRFVRHTVTNLLLIRPLMILPMIILYLWHPVIYMMSYFSRDCRNAVKWFWDSGVQANPSMFQFKIISHSPVDATNAMLQIDDNIVSKPESQSRCLE